MVSSAACKFGSARDQNIEDAHAAMNVKFRGAYRVPRKATVARSLQVKRVGQAADCAGQILLMLRNTFMTGSVVYIDGGGLLV